MSEFSLIGIITQILSALISVLLYKSHKSKFAFYLCIVLLISALFEIVGVFYKYIEKNSYSVYYLYAGIIFSLISMLYHQIVKGKLWRNIIKLLTIIFIIIWGVIFFKVSLFNYVIIIGGCNVSLFIFFYLRQLLLSDEIINYRKLLPFWVSIGFLVFYLPSIPFFILFKYMKDRGLFFVLNILIILMNIFVIYGLLCSKKEKY